MLRKRDLSLTEAFAAFSAANRTPDRSYDEGKANNYPHAPLARAATLSQAAHLSTGPLRLTLDHLAAEHGPLHAPRRAWSARSGGSGLTLDMAEPLEGHRRGGHDPAAQRRDRKTKWVTPRQERQRVAEVQVHDHGR